jgi:hypothetical protein
MKKEDFENQLKEAAAKFASRKNSPKTQEAQFRNGAMWAWELLTAIGTEAYYEEQLREAAIKRLGQYETWMDVPIATAAKTLVDIDETRREISATGRTWWETGYNHQQKRVACPHIAHEKDLVRTLATLYEHLGLSFKTNPEKMTANTAIGGGEHDKLKNLLDDIQSV